MSAVGAERLCENFEAWLRRHVAFAWIIESVE